MSTCYDCKFFNPIAATENNIGHCHGRAPVPIAFKYVSGDSMINGVVQPVLNAVIDGYFPTTNRNVMACGDFKLKTKKKDDINEHA